MNEKGISGLEVSCLKNPMMLASAWKVSWLVMGLTCGDGSRSSFQNVVYYKCT
jgi:hypothetical protein